MAAEGPYAPTPQEWLSPAPAPYAPEPAGLPVPMFELRPLTLGEVLDRTFTLYRSRFWLFAGIAAFSGAVQSVGAAAQMAIQTMVLRRPAFGPNVMALLINLLVTLFFFLAFTITSAATVFAMGEVYLGRAVSIKEAFGATIRRWYAYIAIAFWQLGSMIWLPLAVMVPFIVLLALVWRGQSAGVLAGILLVLSMIAAFVGGYILYLRNSLAISACVTERLKIRPSMRRSKVLSRGAKGRIFVVHVISFCLYMVVGVLQAPLAVLTLMAVAKGGHALFTQALTLIIGFLGHTVVSPVAMIGLTLLYFDQRVRKEAFDLELLLGEEQAVEAGAPAVESAAGPTEISGLETQTGDAPLL